MEIINETASERNSQSNGGVLLLPQHQHLIHESAIAPDVAVERGYRTVTSKAELRRLGFADSQRRVPALLLPIFSVNGDVVNYQIRPDSPRVNNKAKAVKYETIADSKMCLDVPPRVFKNGWQRDPAKVLYITEGIRKADSAVSQGLCCIGLIGVWNWRGTNEFGGKTVLPDWDSIALKDRKVYIVFDSDVVQKREVQAALVRLKSFLQSRGSDVRIIYLPCGADGEKVGLDDYFAAGHNVQELMLCASDELRQLESESGSEETATYQEGEGGLIWQKPTKDGPVPTHLSNFTARIVGDVLEDDGAETRRVFEIEARFKSRTLKFEISALQFGAMRWPVEVLGTGAVIYPGLLDHARCAIQLISNNPDAKHVFTHTGWRRHNDEWVYLHGGGAIGSNGLVGEISVKLASDLSPFVLPEPPTGEELKEAIRACLRLLDVAPRYITFPLLAAAFRAPIGSCDFSLHLTGHTGTGKSCLAALVQQFFGATFGQRHLPASWSSTANALEAQAFSAKDAILTIDDFVPSGKDSMRLHREADRILRAQGNHSGRQRMRADATLRPTKAPRGLIFSTGEDTPAGQSLRGRMLILEISPNTVDWQRLTLSQSDANRGLYAQTMAAYLKFLAGRYEEFTANLQEKLARLREKATKSGMHKRTPEIVANLAYGLQEFLYFAFQAEALTEDEADNLYHEGWQAIGDAASGQATYQSVSDPVVIFFELLQSAIASGAVHLAGIDGREPKSDAQAWGWQRGQAAGKRIGWVDRDEVYLEPNVALAEIQKLGAQTGEPIAISATTLFKRFKERGVLASTDTARRTLKVRRRIEGAERSVLHTRKSLMESPTGENADKADIAPANVEAA